MPFSFENGHEPEAATTSTLKRKFEEIAKDASARSDQASLQYDDSQIPAGVSAAPPAPHFTTLDGSSSGSSWRYFGSAQGQDIMAEMSGSGHKIFSKAQPAKAIGEDLNPDPLDLLRIGVGKPASKQNDHPEFIYNLAELNPLIAAIQKEVHNGDLYPTFSKLHEEIWFEGAMSKEEIAEQRLAYENKGQCMSSFEAKPPGSTNLLKDTSTPRCRKHPAVISQNVDDGDGCDSDCFEEYDPLDDIEELRVAIKRLEMAKGSMKSSKPEKPRTAQQSSRRRNLEPVKGAEISRRPYMSYEARSKLRDVKSDIDLEFLGK
ncbi:hypothetical protein ABW20_dc0108137 [Dactylellina cionopaga]|nr:hypothetical protein ABW20_dc0108137 [Dactylellina cionopaga]